MPRLSVLALVQPDLDLPPIADHTLALCFVGLALWSILAARMVLARVARTARDDGAFRARIAAHAPRGFYLPGLAR